MRSFAGRDILSLKDFERNEFEHVFQIADRLEPIARERRNTDMLAHKTLVTAFYQPSTRTRLAHEAAMHRLGGHVTGFADAKMTRAGDFYQESIKDTVHMLEFYGDVIVMRHPQIGSAAEAAEVATIPVINAGDGAGQHPTQALLDVYTIKKEIDKLDGIQVSLVGDLKYGRTVHALVELLSLYDIGLRLVSPASLKMPADMVSNLKEKGVDVTETDNLAEAAADSDLLYVTRIQKERFSDVAEYEKLKGAYVVDNAMLQIEGTARSMGILIEE